MIDNSPQPDPFGAVLVDKAIRDAIASRDIRIVVPDPSATRWAEQEERFPFGDLQQYVSAVDKEDPANDIPIGALETTGYQLYPLRYYDRRSGKWRLIPLGEKGLKLRPGQDVVIEPMQYVGFSHKYCALHFGRFSGQLSGTSIASGLIQPNWGATAEAPVFTSIRNIGNTPINITRQESLSRLVFFRVSGEILHRGGGTGIAKITNLIQKDQAEIRQRNSRAVWSRRFAYGSGMVALGGALYSLPHLRSLLQVDPQAEQYVGQGIVALIALFGAQLLRIKQRDDLQ